MKRRFGILNNPLGLIGNIRFDENRRDIGRTLPNSDRWCNLIGDSGEWWSSRFIFLTVKRRL